MEKSVFVDISEPISNFIKDGADLILSECSIWLFGSGVDFIQVGVEVVEDQKELVIGKDDLLKFNDIIMIKFA
jgi:hypothetical protein